MVDRTKISISTLRAMKRDGRRIAMLTCYDFSTARLMESAGIDSLLVGDTYAEVCLGHKTTLPAKLDHMVTLCAAVRRGAPTTYLVGDMPYLTYQVCAQEAIRNAGRFLVEGECDCVKVEVDRRLLDTVAAMSAAAVPVMAHLGLKPQSIQSVGGYKVQGKRASEALNIINDAKLMEQAGAIAILLEAVPTEVAEVIASATDLPVIGIASGPMCDGQVLVMHDMLGLSAGHPPRSAKQYAQLTPILDEAFRAYRREIAEGTFPTAAQGTSMDAAELRELHRRLGATGRKRDVKSENSAPSRSPISNA